MKYIRTEDGVYEIERYYEPGDYYWVKQDCEQQPFGSDEIIKQADTIEELCDYYVEYSKKHNALYGYIRNLGIGCYKKFVQTVKDIGNDCIGFGALLTDKGLIYKAKMKGVLPNGEIDWELL